MKFSTCGCLALGGLLLAGGSSRAVAARSRPFPGTLVAGQANLEGPGVAKLAGNATAAGHQTQWLESWKMIVSQRLLVEDAAGTTRAWSTC